MNKKILFILISFSLTITYSQSLFTFDASEYNINSNKWTNSSVASDNDETIFFELQDVAKSSSPILKNLPVLEFTDDSSAILNMSLNAIPKLTENSSSFEIWFKPSTLLGNKVLFESGAYTHGTSLVLQDANVQFIVKTDEKSSHVTARLNSTIFHQVIGVIDFSEDIISIFLDGLKIDQVAFYGTDWSGPDDTKLATKGSVGGNNGSLGNLNQYTNFEGQIALFKVYNYPLSNLDVGRLYSQTLDAWLNHR